MAQSVNGFIAKQNDDTPWSNEEWKSFNKKVQECGNVVIGSRTFKLMQEQIGSKAFKKIKVVVVTSKKHDTFFENVMFVGKPNEALDILKKLKFKTVFMGGGATLNSSFLKQGLVDEVYFDIEPKIFSKGIPFFSTDIKDVNLKLLNMLKIGRNSIQLHYKVVK